MEWLVFLAVAVPMIGIVAWFLLDDSLVRVPTGRLGLLLVRGVPTDKRLEPGLHWVPAFRRRELVDYPALELAYRAGETRHGSDENADLERGGPPLQVMLGDRTEVGVGYTLRFRLDVEGLAGIHTRFGPEGIWAAVRDESGRALRDALADARFGVDDLFGPARVSMETELTAALTDVLRQMGLIVTMFNLGDLDLGRAGDVIQATVRARLELAREEAEAEMRIARARIDAELGPFVDMATAEAALRYREVDSWRDLPPTWGRANIPYSVTSTNAPPPGPVVTPESSVEDDTGEPREPD